MKKTLALLTATSMILAGLAGCGQTGTDAPPQGQGAAAGGAAPAVTAPADTAAQGRDTLVIAMNADIVSMDPQLRRDVPSGRLKHMVFETLVRIDENGDILPVIASDWEIIDDTTIHFTIPSGIRFHNGDELTIDDILFSFYRGMDAPQTGIFLAPIDVLNSRAIDANTLELNLHHPFGAIFSVLADTGAAIVNKRHVQEVGDDEFASNPVGTGPFVFGDWVPGDRVTLTRFEDFHGTPPRINTLVFRVITEATNRSIELETGNVDIALDIAPAEVSRIENHPDLVMERGFSTSVTYMAMNNSREPFNDVRVRQAITLALDLPAIVGAVFEGAGDVGRGPMPASLPGFNNNIQPAQQNVERARELLAEAGFPDGFSTAILTSDHQQRLDFSEIAQNQLRAIGIEVDVNVLEWGAFLDAIFAGEHDMTVLGFSFGPNPASGLESLFSSSSFGPDGNISWFANDRVDYLIDRARTEMNYNARMDMIREIQEIINEEAPWVFIWQGENLNGTTNALRGFRNAPNGFYRFMDMYFE